MASNSAGPNIGFLARPAECLFHYTGCASVTPPPKVLTQFPPSAYPGGVGPLRGVEQTGKTTYSNFQHTKAGWPWGRGGRTGAKTHYSEILRIPRRTSRLPSQGGHPTLSRVSWAVAAWGHPAWRPPSNKWPVLAPASHLLAAHGNLGGTVFSFPLSPPPPKRRTVGLIWVISLSTSSLSHSRHFPLVHSPPPW